MGAGKGDKRRPYDSEKWDKNFDKIKWNSKRKNRKIKGWSLAGVKEIDMGLSEDSKQTIKNLLIEHINKTRT